MNKDGKPQTQKTTMSQERIKTIQPLSSPQARILLPGSKSQTQRAMILAALAEGESQLLGPLWAEDTALLADALVLLGADITHHDGTMTIRGTGGRLQNPGKALYLGNNGTAMRLLTTLVTLGQGDYLLTGSPRLQERPLAPLLGALQAMGVRARGQDREGYPPVIVQAGGFPGGTVILRDLDSSQYVSSLLIAGPLGRKDLSLRLEGTTPSLPYIEMTVALMRQFGAQVDRPEPLHFLVRHGQGYQGLTYPIEGDVSSASYFFLAAALTQGTVRVEPVHLPTLQGDIGFLQALVRTGASVIRGPNWVEVTGGPLVGGEMVFDFGDMPDMVPSLAVLSACRPGRTIITHVAHLRIKESNRLEAIARELTRTGVRAEETADGLIIEGGRPQGAEIETYNDHRMAMSFAVLGLVAPGMKIRNPQCVAKSFPLFWETLERLYPVP